MARHIEERQRRSSGGPLLQVIAAQPAGGTEAPMDGRRRRLVSGPTFDDAAKAFIAEYNVITQGERNADYVAQKSSHVELHLKPFFGGKALGAITAGLIQEYRAHRQTSRVDEKTGEAKRPSRSTLHSEMVTLRQIMKTANRKGWIAALPDMSVAYKKSGKVEHRAWFSPAEYKMLYEATRERAKNPKKERWRPQCEQLHDYVLFMGNTGLRPDECSLLQDRDITIVQDAATGEQILEIEVRGKRGVGHCKSMPGAVHPYQRVRARKNLKPTDLVFGKVQRDLLNSILEELNLKHDREGNERTAYSLRHTYICMRLMEGADIYQVAKNCRTSVEMIEKYYASHIKNTLDTSAINVRRAKPSTTVVDKDAPAKPKASRTRTAKRPKVDK
jgi:integrase